MHASVRNTRDTRQASDAGCRLKTPRMPLKRGAADLAKTSSPGINLRPWRSSGLARLFGGVQLFWLIPTQELCRFAPACGNWQESVS